MPLSDLKPLTAKYEYLVWKKEWDETGLVSNKFHEIHRNLQTNCYLFVTHGKNNNNTLLNRLHIGHFYLTHSFILRKEERGSCLCCM